jgi:ATP-dependent DNA helicase RecG
MLSTKQDLSSILKTTKNHLQKLNNLGIVTVRDLLEFFPRKLESIKITENIDEIICEEKNTLKGEIYNIRSEKTRFKKNIFKADLFLQGGESLSVVWFHKPFLLQRIKDGQTVFLIGKIKYSLGKLQCQSPEIHLQMNIHLSDLRPIYPESQPINSKWLREKITGLLQTFTSFPDLIPAIYQKKYNLISRTEAIKNIHFPVNFEQWENAKKTLAFEELLLIQCRVLQEKFYREKNQYNKYKINFSAEQVSEDFKHLPFELTRSQKQVLHEILQDFSQEKICSRLVQGDVGSGKTIVALLSILQVLRAGFQATILAPTEILAKQHFKSALQFLSKIAPQFSVEILTGSVTAKKKQEIKARLATGRIDLLIGTHAVLTEDTVFQNLAIAIVDEQHRFGVKQRTILGKNNAHLVAMTATPIPRTLALTIYGDQDLSIINELPAGRKKIITKVVSEEKNWQLFLKFIDDQIAKERQVFWVCPLVEESENISAENVKNAFSKLQQDFFPQRRIALLHGKMKPKEKDEIMTAFKNHEFDILVATSVIEVGVDIPKATVMVIENSERFGLSQLHQFRGRIGRNSLQSYCFLLVGDKKDKNKARLKAMEKSNDGLYLSEIDLKLRGSGEIYGLKQSGLPDLKCADFNDLELIQSTKQSAEEILKKDLSLNEFPALKEEIINRQVYFA